MDPLLVGLLTNLAYDSLTRGARLSLRTTVEDRLKAAAEATADEYHELEPDDLLGLFDSDAVDEQAASFREGAPLPLEDLVAALEDHPVELHLHGEPDEVIEDFLLAFEAELTSDRELCQQVILQYVKAQRTRLDVIQTWQETELETLQAAIEELKQEVSALEGLTDPVDLDATLRQLERDGFDLKTSVDFEAGRCEPENYWRRPFFLQEIRKEYAVEREVPPVEDLEASDLATDGGRDNVTATLTADLRAGTQRVVVGAPGSGKSTILKTVANRWEQRDDTGPILYRETGAARAMETATDFIESVETLAAQDDPVLVIVEDAAREATLPVFEAIHEHIDDARVSYLLDSREHEWDRDRFRDLVRRHEAIDLDAEKGKRVVASFGDHIDEDYAPPLDEREVERIIERFEAKTEYSVPQEPAELFERIQSHRGASSMLLLAYSLPVGGFQPELDEDVSMLEENVREIYTAVTDPVAAERTLIDDPVAVDTDRFEQLGLAIVLLNAMEIGVRRELLLTLAEDDSERQAIDEFLEALDGALVFGHDGNRYWSHHELWSYLYLEQHLKSSVQPAIPRQLFEDSVNAALSS